MKDWRKKNRKILNSYFKNYYKEHRTEWNKYRKYPNKGVSSKARQLGRKYELLALSLLKGSNDNNFPIDNQRWDIGWNNLRIEVKVRRKDKAGGYQFVGSKGAISDYHLLFCLDGDTIEKTLFIPTFLILRKIGRCRLYVGNQSVYDKYSLTNFFTNPSQHK